jgi:thioester reductase-like protein
MNLFLTGATGFLGGELLVTLSKRKDVKKIYCLVRSKSVEDANKRLKHVFDLHNDLYQPDRIIPIIANLLDDDLKSKLSSIKELDDINLIVHSAANTSFSKNCDEQVKKVNIDGLEHVLTWAKELKNLSTFLYIGTATICGKDNKDKVIKEEESPNTLAHHLVTYTYTKMMGEMLLSKYLPEEKILVVRPSIIMGDSKNAIPRSSVILWTLAAFNYLRLIPVNPLSKIDIIPVDYAANAISELLFLKKRSYRVYHVSAGVDSSTNSELCTRKIESFFPDKPSHQFVNRKLSNNMRFWAKGRMEDIGELDKYGSHLQYWENIMTEKSKLRILFAGLEPYFDFIELGQVFDNSKLLQDISIGNPQPAHEYIIKNIEFLKGIDIYEGALDP